MKKQKPQFKIGKKLIYKVIAFHFVIILLLAIQTKFNFKKTSKPLAINTIVIKEKPKIKKITAKKVSHKKKISKKIVKKRIQKKRKNIDSSKKLLDELEKEIAKLDKVKKVEEKKEDLFIPKALESLSLDQEIKNSPKEVLKYKHLLVKELQDNLKLPEYGEVKISFLINLDGSISHVKIIKSKSNKNENYLKNCLPAISLSWFNQMFDKPQNFIVIFKND